MHYYMYMSEPYVIILKVDFNFQLTWTYLFVIDIADIVRIA